MPTQTMTVGGMSLYKLGAERMRKDLQNLKRVAKA